MRPTRSDNGEAPWLAVPAGVLLGALVARVVAAWVLQSFVDRMKPSPLCVFPDSNYYWLLARTIRQGGPYEIVEYGTNSFKARCGRRDIPCSWRCARRLWVNGRWGFDLRRPCWGRRAWESCTC